MYPIYFDLNIESTAWQQTLKVFAFLPMDYPDTPLKQTFGGKVAEVILTIRSGRITILHLRVYSSSRTQGVSPSEIRATKGLGKAILCYALQQAWDYFQRSLGLFSDVIIDLETGATNFYDESEFAKRVEKNQYLSRQSLISKIMEWYPDVELEEYDEDQLREIYTELKENRQLATYYQNTYGFEPIFEVDSIQNKTIVMEAPAQIVFERCNQ